MTILNGKILFATLVLSGAVASLLLIGQLWFDILEWSSFIKALVTISIISALAGFLIAVNYDTPSSRKKEYMLHIVVFLALLMGGLIIAQIWCLALAWGSFVKIFCTVLILFVLVSFFLAVKEDFGTNKRLKDDHYLD